MESLTREQAIKRIRDIKDHNQIEHIKNAMIHVDDIIDCAFNDCLRAVIAELMAIFDIKEEEL